jgi:hypothetical protein
MTIGHRGQKHIVQARYIVFLLLAASLSGCGSYAMFDAETAGAFASPGKQAAWTKSEHTSSADPETTGATSASSDKSDNAALSSLFAKAAQGKLNGDTAAPGPAPAAKPVVVADADADDGTLAPEPPPVTGQKVTAPRGRAYLFRGVAGLIYSRGMDKLAERIKRTGIGASVDSYLVWRGVADEAIRDYRRDPAPITLIGHSMGGDFALDFAERLNAASIPVSLLVTLDPTRIADDVPPNVERYINLYQSSNFMGGGNVVQGSRFHGHYASYNLKDHGEIVHINIEKTERIQEQVIAKIAQLAGTPAGAEGETVPIHLEVPADAAIELWDSGLPVQAHAGDTLKTLAVAYHLPLWSLAQINSMPETAALDEGQRIVVPRHLFPMAMPGAVSSYAPTER